MWRQIWLEEREPVDSQKNEVWGRSTEPCVFSLMKGRRRPPPSSLQAPALPPPAPCIPTPLCHIVLFFFRFNEDFWHLLRQWFHSKNLIFDADISGSCSWGFHGNNEASCSMESWKTVAISQTATPPSFNSAPNHPSPLSSLHHLFQQLCTQPRLYPQTTAPIPGIWVIFSMIHLLRGITQEGLRERWKEEVEKEVESVKHVGIDGRGGLRSNGVLLWDLQTWRGEINESSSGRLITALTSWMVCMFRGFAHSALE